MLWIGRQFALRLNGCLQHCIAPLMTLCVQVVLVRDLEARERLPAELKASNALIMTVGQSKGLEFDDCFLVGELH